MALGPLTHGTQTRYEMGCHCDDCLNACEEVTEAQSSYLRAFEKFLFAVTPDETVAAELERSVRLGDILPT